MLVLNEKDENGYSKFFQEMILSIDDGSIKKTMLHRDLSDTFLRIECEQAFEAEGRDHRIFEPKFAIEEMLKNAQKVCTAESTALKAHQLTPTDLRNHPLHDPLYVKATATFVCTL